MLLGPCFLYITFLINRLPTPVLSNQTPYSILYKSYPDYTMLRVFGCACYPCLRPYNKNKLEFRTSECTFLGYSTSHKGYKCLAKDGRMYISKDVQFNGHVFPFAKENSNSRVSPVQTSLPSPIPLTVVPPIPSSTSLSQSTTGSIPLSHLHPSHPPHLSILP